MTKNYIGMRAGMAPAPWEKEEADIGTITAQSEDEIMIEFDEGGYSWGPVEYEKDGVVYIA